MTAKKTKYAIAALAILAVGLGTTFMFTGAGHTESSEEGAQQSAPQAMPVEVVEVAPEKMRIWKSFSGHVVAVDQAEIRPQVSGRITEVRFEDGQHVQKGDVLIVIDPRPYEASLNQAKAAYEAAETQAALADKEYQRAKKLISSDAISQSTLDARENNRKSTIADVQGAKAALERAEIDLDYAFVKAPISGKISRAEVTEGNLVQAGPSAPLLTSVVSDEKVYVDFEVDERTYISSVQAMPKSADKKIPVRIELLGNAQQYEGVIHSFDNRIDRASGTIRARAIFDNEDGLLLPGMSVSVNMGGSDEERILLTERAIGTDQDRKFVFTVNGDKVAKYREVKIGESIKGRRVILSGLETGEKVISEGLALIRPGMPVTPKMPQSSSEGATQ